MEKLIEKISTYNLFNYLLPGVLFTIFAKYFLHVNLTQENVILDIFLYYFIGLVVSRLGSLIVESSLKKVKFLKFAKYEDFIETSQVDSKIEIFSEANNMYRTFVAMFVLLLATKFYFYIQTFYICLQKWSLHILIILLLVMFLYSYKKQTTYIFSRIYQIKK